MTSEQASIPLLRTAIHSELRRMPPTHTCIMAHQIVANLVKALRDLRTPSTQWHPQFHRIRPSSTETAVPHTVTFHH